MFQKIMSFYKKARPILNNLRNRTLRDQNYFTGTLNQLLDEHLQKYDNIRFIRTDSDSNLTTTIHSGFKDQVVTNLYKLNLDFNQTHKFNYSLYEGKNTQALYIDLELDNDLDLNNELTSNDLKYTHEQKQNNQNTDEYLKRYILLKAIKKLN